MESIYAGPGCAEGSDRDAIRYKRKILLERTMPDDDTASSDDFLERLVRSETNSFRQENKLRFRAHFVKSSKEQLQESACQQHKNHLYFVLCVFHGILDLALTRDLKNRDGWGSLFVRELVARLHLRTLLKAPSRCIHTSFQSKLNLMAKVLTCWGISISRPMKPTVFLWIFRYFCLFDFMTIDGFLYNAFINMHRRDIWAFDIYNFVFRYFYDFLYEGNSAPQ